MALTDALEQELARRLLDVRLTRRISVPQPLPGAEWLAVTPSGVDWLLLQVRQVFSASAVVANRLPALRHNDADGTQIGRYAAIAAVAASNSPTLVYSSGYGAPVNGGPLCAPLPSPPIVLRSGDQVGSFTSAFDVGDQYSGIVLVVQELSVEQIRLQMAWINEMMEG